MPRLRKPDGDVEKLWNMGKPKEKLTTDCAEHVDHSGIENFEVIARAGL
jgi:hypothetical protein